MNMRIDKLTSKFQMALADAQSLAVGQDHAYIEPVHLMLALLDQEGGSVRPLLAKVGANLSRFRNALDAQLDKLPTVTGTRATCRYPRTSPASSTSRTSWRRSARTSSSPPSFTCWRPSTARDRWRTPCAIPVHPSRPSRKPLKRCAAARR